FLLFWAVLFTGSLDGAVALGNLDPSVQTIGTTSKIQKIEPGTAADGVLKAGDQILTVEGHQATEVETVKRISAHTCAGDLTEGCHAATPVRLTVRRAGRDLALAVYPRYSKA